MVNEFTILTFFTSKIHFTRLILPYCHIFYTKILSKILRKTPRMIKINLSWLKSDVSRVNLTLTWSPLIIFSLSFMPKHILLNSFKYSYSTIQTFRYRFTLVSFLIKICFWMLPCHILIVIYTSKNLFHFRTPHCKFSCWMVGI